MINPLWHPVMVKAAFQHFYGGIMDASTYVYVPGTNDLRPKKTEWCEIRFKGPDIVEQSAGCFHAELDVDILIESAVRKNVYYLAMITGEVASLFHCFQVYLDSSTILGSFDLLPANDFRSGVKISNFGLVKDLNHERASVEGIFEMDFTQGGS